MERFNWYLDKRVWNVPEDTSVWVFIEDIRAFDSLFNDYDTADSFCYQVWLLEQELENAKI